MAMMECIELFRQQAELDLPTRAGMALVIHRFMNLERKVDEQDSIEILIKYF